MNLEILELLVLAQSIVLLLIILKITKIENTNIIKDALKDVKIKRKKKKRRKKNK